jgi:methyl-accepting chemotaxis protein
MIFKRRGRFGEEVQLPANNAPLSSADGGLEVDSAKEFGALSAALGDFAAELQRLLDSAGPDWSEPARHDLAALSSAATPAGLAELLTKTATNIKRLPRLGNMEAAAALSDAGLILPLARAVLAAVSPKTEEATMDLLDRFGAVQAASEKAAESSRGLIERIEGRNAGESVSVVAEHSRQAIQAERETVARIVKNNGRNVDKLRAMDKEIDSGIGLVNEIEEITDRSRLIAFNMAVEAAHIGEKGLGFKVIVKELQRLNDRTVDFSHRIVELLKKYKDYSAALVVDMQEHSNRLNDEVMGGMSSSGTAVEALISSSKATEELSRQLASVSLEVRGNLDRVIEALQFQDLTRQMLEGALGMLDDLGSRVAKAEPLLGALSRRDGSARRRRLEELQNEYISKSKTKDEKLAIKEVRP